MITIDVYFPNKGYGFASLVDSERNRTILFFHIKDVLQGDPVADAKIQCDVEMGKKGFVAKNIRVLSQVAGLSALAQPNGGAQ